MNFGHAPLTNWGLDLIEFQDGWTMLDIGGGGGATLKRLLKRSKGSRVYGIDISEENVAKARKVNDALLGNGVPDWKRDVRAAAEVAARLCCRPDGGCLVLVTAIACSGDAGRYEMGHYARCRRLSHRHRVPVAYRCAHATLAYRYHTNLSTILFAMGFMLMMVLDVVIG